jgi:5-methylcytosine-specific restriction endonuclease McrA
MTKHHITPKSRGGSSELENIAMINSREHNVYHQLFDNKTPEEIVYYLNSKFWNDNYVIEIRGKYG